MADHGAADDFVDVHAGKAEAIDEASKRGRQHVEVAEIGIERVRATEGNSGPADDRHLPNRLLHSLETPIIALTGAWARGVCRDCGAEASVH
jgi:hypothetical protein